MAILSKKKASFADLNSKVIDKIKLFNHKKADAQSAVSEFQLELNDIQAQIVQKETEYKDTLDTALLREIADLMEKKGNVTKLMQIQRQAFGNGKTVLELTDADRKDLANTFAPHRKRELDLTDKMHKQIAELEKTLEELDAARNEYWNDFYAPMMGTALHATGNQFAVHFLKEDQSLRKGSVKLQELAYHKALPKGFF